MAIVGHVLSCTLVAYAFARLRAPGKDALFPVLLATMMLPDPLIDLHDQTKYTVSLGLSFYRSSYDVR
jgi:ABC-type glycerol-3-phosphate transport system permease component